MSDYDLLRYAKQGIIIPLENLIDKYMPNLQAVFEAYPEYRTMCTAPDEAYDRLGCFSGSAIEADGKHVLVYTGVTRIHLSDGSEQERQNQCIAFGDGVDYVKYEGNPVVKGEMLPEDCSRIDFRDPKIWKEGDRYYLIVGNKNQHQIGQVCLLYTSPSPRD